MTRLARVHAELLNKSAAAEVLGVGVRTLERLTASGDLPHVRPSPRRVLYRRTDLDAHIQRTTTTMRPRR